MVIARKIGCRLRAARIEKGLSVKRLAELSGFARSYLYQLEKGDAQPSRPAVEKLGRVLGVAAEYLAGETDQPQFIAILESQLSHDEHDLVRMYRALPAHDKRVIDRVLSLAYSAASVLATRD